jgi:FkbM family methyltransferase
MLRGGGAATSRLAEHSTLLPLRRRVRKGELLGFPPVWGAAGLACVLICSISLMVFSFVTPTRLLLKLRSPGPVPRDAAMPQTVVALTAGCVGADPASLIVGAESHRKVLEGQLSLGSSGGNYYGSEEQGVRKVEVVYPPGVSMALHPRGELVSDAIVTHQRPFCPAGFSEWLRLKSNSAKWLGFGASGGTLLDIGANIGSCSLVAAGWGMSAIAIEANPANSKLLLTSLAMSVLHSDAHVHLVPVAVGSSNGTLQMLSTATNMGASMMMPDTMSNEKLLEAASVAGMTTRSATTLSGVPTSACIRVADEAVSAASVGLPPVVALKMDVQGHEVDVLRGLVQTLSTQPIERIEMEVWPPMLRAKGFDPSEIYSILTPLGFQVVEMSYYGSKAGFEKPTLEELKTDSGWKRCTGEDAGTTYTLDTTWERIKRGVK